LHLQSLISVFAPKTVKREGYRAGCSSFRGDYRNSLCSVSLGRSNRLLSQSTKHAETTKKHCDDSTTTLSNRAAHVETMQPRFYTTELQARNLCTILPTVS